MANPTVSDRHVNRPLTDLSVAYGQEVSAYIAWQVFPIVPVQSQGDSFFEYDEKDWFRDDVQPRAPGAPIAMGGYRLSEDTYNCRRKGLGVPISDPERANADPAVSNLDADAVAYLTEQIYKNDEIDWVSDFFTDDVWDGASSTTDMDGSSTAPGSTATAFLQWNDVASTPIEDIHGEEESIAKRTGKRPNTLVLGSEVWRHIQDHPDILDRIKYTERGVVTEDLVASLLGLDRVLISRAVKNTAYEGSTSATMSFVAGKNALLCYVTPTPGLRTATAGYQFVWTGASGSPASGVGARVKRYRDEPKESDIIEMEKWRDFKVIGSQLGAFFSGAVA